MGRARRFFEMTRELKASESTEPHAMPHTRNTHTHNGGGEQHTPRSYNSQLTHGASALSHR